jgi:hypothetical protein
LAPCIGPQALDLPAPSAGTSGPSR